MFGGTRSGGVSSSSTISGTFCREETVAISGVSRISICVNGKLPSESCSERVGPSGYSFRGIQADLMASTFALFDLCAQ